MKALYKKREKFLVFGAPQIMKEDIDEVVDTIKSGWWGTGPKTERFENDFIKHSGAKYAISVNSATAGLHLALLAMGIGPGDEVITTPLTFVATANVIVHVGATPVFADVEPDTWNINPEEIRKRITKKTKAIMPVHLHGRPANMKEIKKIAKEHNLYIIEDAAHAVEAEYKNKHIGNIGDITVFSFYVTKNVATGEGGMITTNNKKFAERMKMLRLHGLSRDAYKRYSVKHFTLYEAVEPGYKYNLTDIASSLGIHQLERVNKNHLVREKIWNKYIKAFKGHPLITLPTEVEKGTVHGMHLFAILLDLEKITVDRNTFVDVLIKENIGSGVHFSSVHLHEYYRKTFGYKRGDYPISEFVGDRVLSLPLGASLTAKDTQDVIDAVLIILEKVKKI